MDDLVSFGEELFTYVRIYGSPIAPHVLPLYVPSKLLAREVSYQTVGNGLTKSLKEAKKSISPSFPICCGLVLEMIEPCKAERTP